MFVKYEPCHAGSHQNLEMLKYLVISVYFLSYHFYEQNDHDEERDITFISLILIL